MTKLSNYIRIRRIKAIFDETNRTSKRIYKQTNKMECQIILGRLCWAKASTTASSTLRKTPKIKLQLSEQKLRKKKTEYDAEYKRLVRETIRVSRSMENISLKEPYLRDALSYVGAHPQKKNSYFGQIVTPTFKDANSLSPISTESIISIFPSPVRSLKSRTDLTLSGHHHLSNPIC